MRHIDFKALGVFVQVMHYGSIGRAAQALGVRQPTVAYAIRKLRDVTGDELFFERRGGLVPTAYGLKLERAAAGMLERWNGLVANAGARAPRGGGPRQTLRIGVSMALGDPALTQVLTRLSAALPDVHIASSVIGNGRHVGQALAKGQLDCAVTVDALPGAGGVLAEHVMMAQRSLIRLPAPPSAEEEATGNDMPVREHWTLLSDDADAESPVRRYLADVSDQVRLTVAPSWNGQVALWRSRGGVTPVLKFNVPWIDGANRAYVAQVPEGFPAWADVSLLYLGGRAQAAHVDAVREALVSVMRGIAAATVPLPANDSAVALVG
ncbi:LysR family transcriptional regulator [Cupriavidus sp. NPDC089707]|uniref:LysR family transcriptional regulator n=1 Tax=Cupriavidus sp. NPDC089707 TaxID=3363963 RepID=UPI0038143A5A